jgi:hypothetical protein
MILQLYSVVGGVFLFKYGPFLFFTYPEWYGIVWALCDITRSSVLTLHRQIYGGIAMAVAGTALLTALAFANVSVPSIHRL